MLGLRMAVAKACKAYADQLKTKNPRLRSEARKLLSDGRKQVTYLTRFANDYQEACVVAVAGIRRGRCRRPRGPIKNICEAKNAAKVRD